MLGNTKLLGKSRRTEHHEQSYHVPQHAGLKAPTLLVGLVSSRRLRSRL
jgi:hypothetical protein